MYRNYQKVLTVTLTLYAIGTLTTMAGMEIFGWLSAALVLFGTIAFRNRQDVLSSLNVKNHSWLSILTGVDYALLTLMAIIVLSALAATPDSADKVFVAGNSRFVLLFLLLRIGIELVSPRKSERLFPWLIAIVAIVGVYAIFQNKTGIDLIRGHRNPIQQEVLGSVATYRARGMWDHPVRFGHSIALSLCFPLAFLIGGYARRSPHAKLLVTLCCFTLAVGVAGLFYSFTRGAWIGFAAAVFTMSLYVGRKFALRAVMAGVLAVAIAILLSPALQGRFVSMLQPRTDGSSAARLDIWRANIEMFKDHPVLGVGYGLNEELITQYYEKLGITQQDGGHAHNNFLQVLSGTGLLGFAAYMAFSLFALLLAHQLIRRSQTRDDRFGLTIGLAAVGAQMVIHIGGLTECSFKSAQINHQYFLILALMIAMLRNAEVKAA